MPPPALGGGVVPPPSFGDSAVPAPDLGLGGRVDVAPPPFMSKKKKKRIEKKQIIIEEEVYVDVGEVIDPKAAGRRRFTSIICVVLALPLFFAFFWVGKSRQNWALEGRSRDAAGTLVEKMTKAGPVLQKVQSRTAAALGKAKASEVDEDYITFTQNVAKQRPLSNADFDMVNYAAFEPEVVDRLYELNRMLETIWAEMASHRNLMRNDLQALNSHQHMEVPATQIRFGVALINIYEDVYGVNIGVISNPGQDADGHRTLDLQVRPGRKSHAYRHYLKGSFGEKVKNWVIPVAPEQTAPGAPLEDAEGSHMKQCIKRLTEINDMTGKAVKLHGELVNQLRAISG